MERDGRSTMMFAIALLPALIALGLSGDDQVSTSLVQDEFVTRVPVRPVADTFEWAQAKGPRCLPLGLVRGALLSPAQHVDLVMASGRRFRVRFDGACPALDFYDGFYVGSPNRMICAGRDSIRSRIGASCAIESFAELVPLTKRLP